MRRLALALLLAGFVHGHGVLRGTPLADGDALSVDAEARPLRQSCVNDVVAAHKRALKAATFVAPRDEQVS